MTPIFFEATPRGIVVYRDGEPAIIATKFGQYIRLAKEGLEGLVRVPDPAGGDMIEWVDHPALLRMSAAAALLAAESYV